MATIPFNMAGTGAFSSSVDGVNDSVPFWQSSTSEAFYISRNTFLNIVSQPVGTTDTLTLTNKTLTSPTISGPTLSGTIGGTYVIGGTPTFPSSVATLTGTQTLTNKTLTSPAITGGTIANPTLTTDTVAGYTTSNTGTVYGVSVTAGVIASAALAGAVNTAALATNAVGASNLAANAITLGYAQITGNVAITGTTATQVTGLTVTVTIPGGGRKVKITVQGTWDTSTAAAAMVGTIWSGTVGSGTQLAGVQATTSGSGVPLPMIVMAVHTPSAGSLTYNFGLQTSSGSDAANVLAASTSPAFILVEAI